MANFDLLAYGRLKGRFLYHADNALYVTTRTVNNSKGLKVVYLKCNTSNCGRQAKIVDNYFYPSNRVEHNHIVDDSISKLHQAYSELIEKVRTSHELIRPLHTDMLRRMPIEIASEMPWKRVRESLRRARSSVLPACRNVVELIDNLEKDPRVREVYGEYRNEPLYRGSITVNGRTSVIFAVEQHLSKLKNGFNMYCDGTFAIIPNGFNQLFVIMGEIDGWPRLIAYVLMEGCYNSMVKATEDDDEWKPVNGKLEGKRSMLNEILEKIKSKGPRFKFGSVKGSIKPSGTKSYILYMTCQHDQKVNCKTPKESFHPVGGIGWDIVLDCDICSRVESPSQEPEKKKQKKQQQQEKEKKPQEKKKFHLKTRTQNPSLFDQTPAPTPAENASLRKRALAFADKLKVRAAVTVDSAINRILTADYDADIMYKNLISESATIGIQVAAAMANTATEEKVALGLSKSSAAVRNNRALTEQFKWTGGPKCPTSSESSSSSSSSSAESDHE